MRGALIEYTEQVKAKALKTARDAGQHVTHFANEALEMKAGIAETLENGLRNGRRAVKHGYRASEDFVDDAAHRIKRDPLRALGLSFVVGIAVGWLLPHRTRA